MLLLITGAGSSTYTISENNVQNYPVMRTAMYEAKDASASGETLAVGEMEIKANVTASFLLKVDYRKFLDKE